MSDTGLTGTGVVGDYLTGLDRRISGPRAAKRDLLAEARDSLLDATAAYRDHGMPEHEAQRRAVAEFGAQDVIVREFQAELGVAVGIRALRAVLLLVPLLHVLWESARRLLLGTWNDAGFRPPAWFLGFTDLYDLFPWVAGVLAAGALLAGRWLSRRAVDPQRLGRMTNVVGLGVLAAHLASQVGVVTGSCVLDPPWFADLPILLQAMTLLCLGTTVLLIVRFRRGLVLSMA